jgi:hypothetical protein
MSCNLILAQLFFLGNLQLCHLCLDKIDQLRKEFIISICYNLQGPYYPQFFLARLKIYHEYELIYFESHHVCMSHKLYY